MIITMIIIVMVIIGDYLWLLVIIGDSLGSNPLRVGRRDCSESSRSVSLVPLWPHSLCSVPLGLFRSFWWKMNGFPDSLMKGLVCLSPLNLPVLCGCSVGCAPLAPFGSGGRHLQVGGMKTSGWESFLILRSGHLWLSLYPWLGRWIPCGQATVFVLHSRLGHHASMVFRSLKLSVAPLWPFRYPHHMVQLFQVPLSWLLTMRILPLLSQVCLLVLPLLRSRMVFVWLFRGSNSHSTRSSHGTLSVLLTSFQALLASMQCLHMLWPRSAPPQSTSNLAMTKQCSTLSPAFFGSDQFRMDWNRPSSRHVTLPTSPFIAPLCLVLRPPGMACPSL